MPQHSSTQKIQKKKPTTGGSVATRSQVTGRQLGRAALRALEKNANCIDQFLTKIDEAEDMYDLQQIEDVDAFIVARVIRAEGAGWFNVRCRDGSEAKVHVAGTIAFHGRAGTKTDRDNCIIMNDIIIVSGGRASAKLSAALAAHVKKVYSSHGFPFPKHFFSRGDGEDDGAEDDIFDRSDDEEVDVATIAKLTAPKSKSNAAPDDDDDDDSVIDVDAI
jgi:hypothetical protein